MKAQGLSISTASLVYIQFCFNPVWRSKLCRSVIGCIRCPGPTSDHSWLASPGAAFRRHSELSTGRRSRRIPGICGSGCQSFIPLSRLRLRLMLRWSDQQPALCKFLLFTSDPSWAPTCSEIWLIYHLWQPHKTKVGRHNIIVSM